MKSCRSLHTLDEVTEDEKHCERQFIDGCKRDEYGRYIVRLPLKRDPAKFLGNTLPFALRVLESTLHCANQDH